ncbi:MAG: 30S ribosomal protein S13 [Candidatus Aenigmatarchaeota archaeon]
MVDVKDESKIVRLAATDIVGSFTVRNGLRKIKGVSFMFVNALCNATGVDPTRKLGSLTESEIKSIEGLIVNPSFPEWLLNRRKDAETGKNVHKIGAILDFRVKEDINLMKKMRCYKGIRHELGQPARGQRTRSTFRTNKTVGVSRVKAMPGKKPTTAPVAKSKTDKK